MGLLNSAMQFGTGAINATRDSVNLGLKDVAEKENMKLAQEAQASRDAVLEQYQVKRADVAEERAVGREERTETRAVGREARGYQHAIDIAGQGREFTKTENELNRTLQRELEASREKATGERHRQTIGVQMAQLELAKKHTTLVPQADGSMIKMTPDGRSEGTLTDLSGNIVYGPKDIAKSSQLMMETNNKVLEGLKDEMRTAIGEEEKAAIRAKRDFYVEANRKLAGLASEPKTGGRLVFDTTTKDVLRDGMKIGTAKDEADARRRYGAGATTAAPAATPTPARAEPPAVAATPPPAPQTAEGILSSRDAFLRRRQEMIEHARTLFPPALQPAARGRKAMKDSPEVESLLDARGIEEITRRYNQLTARE